LSQRAQEIVALAIVAVAAGEAVAWVFRRWGADPLSHWLLKRGRVKWAMRVRSWKA
jgi:hypothetical protein